MSVALPLPTSLVKYFNFLFLIVRPPPRSTLFPYTTLFRSGPRRRAQVQPPRRAQRPRARQRARDRRSEEHTSELQSLRHLVCHLLLEKKKVSDTSFQMFYMRTLPLVLVIVGQCTVFVNYSL